jgi:hypothetical protein
VKFVSKSDQEARAKAWRPTGEWNSAEIVSRNGQVYDVFERDPCHHRHLSTNSKCLVISASNPRVVRFIGATFGSKSELAVRGNCFLHRCLLAAISKSVCLQLNAMSPQASDGDCETRAGSLVRRTYRHNSDGEHAIIPRIMLVLSALLSASPVFPQILPPNTAVISAGHEHFRVTEL